jgi:hypothetical protein
LWSLPEARTTEIGLDGGNLTFGYGWSLQSQLQNIIGCLGRLKGRGLSDKDIFDLYRHQVAHAAEDLKDRDGRELLGLNIKTLTQLNVMSEEEIRANIALTRLSVE